MPAIHPFALRLAIAAAIVASAACAADQPPAARGPLPTDPTLERAPEPGRPTVTGVVSITLTPASSTVAVGGSVPLTATAINHAGQILTNPGNFTFSSSNAGVATISATGVVTAVAAGTATMTAAARNGITGTAAVTVTGGPPPPAASTLIAAGDIAVCPTTFDEATADLIDTIPGTVAPLGDLAYPAGTATDFANCYKPSWGRHKSRTLPAIGNHEYQTANGAAYFSYFGAAAGDPAKAYYSYDLGDWHIVVLNSNCTVVACAAGSPQEQWLRADLAATAKACILAYWHHPRFSSDVTHGSNTAVAAFWNALYQYRADVVLNGHSHVYERFGQQTPAAVADPQGIRQFTVGTGGKSPFYNWGSIKANSQVRQRHTFGVLKLTLNATSYSWNFVPISGATWTDSGSNTCH